MIENLPHFMKEAMGEAFGESAPVENFNGPRKQLEEAVNHVVEEALLNQGFKLSKVQLVHIAIEEQYSKCFL